MPRALKDRRLRQKLAAKKRWMCGRKRGYESALEAQGIAGLVMPPEGKQMNVYQCQFCGQFHIGKTWATDDRLLDA